MKKIPFILFTLTFFYLLSNFLAPLLLEPGTVENLNGGANRVDYLEKWKNMASDGHVFEAFIYLFGDFNCHQKHIRSFEIHGNQMPICARDIGIFTGATIGFFLLFFATPFVDFYKTFFSIFPLKIKSHPFVKRHRKILFFGIMLLAILPIGVDGTYQLISGKESTNFMRMVTGVLFGAPMAAAFGAFLMSGLDPSFGNERDRDDRTLPEESISLIKKETTQENKNALIKKEKQIESSERKENVSLQS